MSIDKSILSPEIRAFAKAHENESLPELILKGSPFDHIKIQDIAQQIKGLQTAKEKFPILYDNEHIIYPPKINLEQSSSEITARYKANLISKNDRIIDITGGMGIDAMAFYEISGSVIYIESDPNTYAYTVHNFKARQQKIRPFNADGIEFLKKNNDTYNWIYIDPARRDEQNSKVFRFEDCQPDVLEHMNLFKSKASKLMIKASPLLDINQSLELLPHVESVHVISVKNETKELLLIINFEKTTTNPTINAVNLATEQNSFSAKYSDRLKVQTFSLPQRFLYEPNASIMKSGFFGNICEEYSLSALHPNSHLFTSSQNIEFPGRKFKIIKTLQPKKKLINKHLKDKKANISTRNYPLKPEQIKKKYGISDGGSLFVFFTTNLKNEKIALICKKLII